MEKTKESNKFLYYLKEIIPYVVIVLVVILIRTFLFTPIRVSGSSMDPTLKDGYIMILNKIAKIDRFDIVVVKSSGSRPVLIKRVIGLPGETVEVRDGNLYINGKKTKDNYGKSITLDFKSVKVPKGQYFVLGDNRVVSADSRIYGTIKKEDIKGTTKLIIFPLNKIGNVK